MGTLNAIAVISAAAIGAVLRRLRGPGLDGYHPDLPPGTLAADSSGTDVFGVAMTRLRESARRTEIAGATPRRGDERVRDEGQGSAR